MNDNDLRSEVVKFVQAYHKRHGQAPSIKKICTHCKTYYKRLKETFPAGLSDICAASGVPVPTDRIKQVQKATRKRQMKAARRRGKETPTTVKESPSFLKLQQLVDSLVETVLDTLTTLHFSEVSSSNPSIGNLADDAARKLLERIGESDPNYLREVLERSGYLGFLESYGVLNFDVQDAELGENMAGRRRKWVDLLKRYHPKLLTDYLT